ncbi:MAG: valine--tRNA ligase [Deltaproteobacteria bacterium HGW-Deltaproteobacteria-14]|nr:MAG: valine--tRNA ligase [Deltaproteobacteria bacterium HGW-Deltaproteobacteria-14]
MIELPKAYEHLEIEKRWYPIWEEKGYFAASETSDKPPYTIVIPPPNVTGSLHMGHALMLTLEDVLTRWRRMQGYNTLWLPGTDHAGIATQMVVERELAKDGVSRFDLGRDAFIAKVWEWKQHYHARITTQMKVIGVSVDWSRERFTMDDGLSRAVRKVFVDLYDDGLIYREKRLVNWSPGIHTVLSDLEVEYRDIDSSLWYMAYPVTGGGERLVVATTRPETMLGDTAVAVHPDDPRYQHLIGKTVDLPLTGRQIPIVGDAILVDPAFGTGAVKVTPAHDFNDFETGKRHDLPLINILDRDARLNENVPEVYRGLDRYEARKKVVADLDALGLMVEIKPHKLNLGHCQRTGVPVEPLLSDQWYVKIEPLAKPAIAAVEDGRTVFTSKEWEKVYFQWMTNIRDWCISRQLWWGHQIPAWFCDDCDHITVALDDPAACAKCGGTALRQDEDVLDTWFSSGLWPFSTLGWPDETVDLKKFYPTSLMETGFDIIFFWVARMMMFGLYTMGDVPFKTIYMHPMVRDDKGQKMSKTKNNVIDPLVETEVHGADALRFTLAALTTQGHDLKLSKERLVGYRAFANKIWNATRFVLMNLPDGEAFTPVTPADVGALSLADRWVLTKLDAAIDGVTDALERFDFQAATTAVHAFFWGVYCDWYIELTKSTLKEGGAEAVMTRRVLMHVLDQALRLLHPFMPYITEEIWTQLPLTERDAPSLTIAAWPERHAELRDDHALALLDQVIDIINAVRTVRGENGISPRTELKLVVSGPDQATLDLVLESQSYLAHLAGVAELATGVDLPRPPKSAVSVAGACTVYVPLEGLIDLGEEVARLEKAVAKIDKEIAKTEAKLGNERFIANAPPEVVEEQRRRLEEGVTQRRMYQNSIDLLKG